MMARATAIFSALWERAARRTSARVCRALVEEVDETEVEVSEQDDSRPSMRPLGTARLLPCSKSIDWLLRKDASPKSGGAIEKP
jgi:hypothetical protein